MKNRVSKTVWSICVCATAMVAVGVSSNCASAAEKLETQLQWRRQLIGSAALDGTAEIAAYDTANRLLFVTSAHGVFVVRAADGSVLGQIELPQDFHATSVAVSKGRLAVALVANDKRLAGRIDLFDSLTRERLGTYPAGHLPDMICFTPDGRYLLTANEGEPTDAYDFDPEGSVTVVDLSHGPEQASVVQCGFKQFNSQREQLLKRGIRLFGPSATHEDQHATVAEDLEPEFIAVSPDSARAWVTLQENNAVAEVDLAAAQVTALHALGEKDFNHLPIPSSSSFAKAVYSTTGLDASDQDAALHVQHWPVRASFEPDAIAHFSHGGQEFLITANEGDPREYAAYHEAVPAGEIAARTKGWDRRAAARLFMDPNQLGRLEVSLEQADSDGDGYADELHAFGTRSFSIWRVQSDKQDDRLELVFDSGSDFERVLAEQQRRTAQPLSEVDCRSHKRGPEPEGVVVGMIDGRRYACVGLERASGVIIYDVTDPYEPQYCSYLPAHSDNGLTDCAPEGLVWVPSSESPTGKPLLIVCHEVSATITTYSLGHKAPSPSGSDLASRPASARRGRVSSAVASD